MTIYAYKMSHQARFGTRHSTDPWFNLTADTQDELHEFVKRLGLPRQGFQQGSLVGSQQVSVSWHYPVTEGEHDRAIELGAQPITPQEVTKIERQRAAALGVI